MSTPASDTILKEEETTALKGTLRGSSPQTPAAPSPAPQAAMPVDDSKAQACYSNFCRVTGTPEELIIDFGLNSQPMGIPTEPIVIIQRLVTNFFTAKRLLQALHMTVQRHEAAFGVLETDIQKRAQKARG